MASIISSADEFKNPCNVFACIMRHNDMCQKDLVSWYPDFVPGKVFSAWLHGSGAIDSEKANKLVSENRDLKEVATTLCEHFYKERMGYDKFYSLLADFISKYEYYRNELFWLIEEQEDADANAILTSSPRDNDVSVGYSLETDARRVFNHRKSLSLGDRYILATDVTLDKANAFDVKYITK